LELQGGFKTLILWTKFAHKISDNLPTSQAHAALTKKHIGIFSQELVWLFQYWLSLSHRWTQMSSQKRILLPLPTLLIKFGIRFSQFLTIPRHILIFGLLSLIVGKISTLRMIFIYNLSQSIHKFQPTFISKAWFMTLVFHNLRCKTTLIFSRELS